MKTPLIKPVLLRYKTPRLMLIALSAASMLAACGTATTAQNQQSSDTRINSALEKAAYGAAASGNSKQSLGYLEKLYKRNSDDPVAASNYARALREGNYLNRASMVLAPFANTPSSPAIAKREYAGIMLAKGEYDEAEDYAKQAILQDNEDFKSYHYLGIALDAKGMHPEAERAFRKGLDHWQGDPTSIMNNLALNLTSQNHLDEAIEILRKAKAIDPNKIEIERNLRIVTALQQSTSVPAPKPTSKPKATATIQPIVKATPSDEPASITAAPDNNE